MYNHCIYTINGIPMARNIKSDGKAPSMAEVLPDPRTRKAQNQFLNQVDKMIDRRPIRTLINKKYTKKHTDAAGAPAYDVIVLFKMMLLQTWYGLSDCAPGSVSTTPSPSADSSVCRSRPFHPSTAH